MEVVAVNDPFMTIDYAVYLLTYDSVHGKMAAEVSHDGSNLIVGGKKIQFFAEKDPAST